MAADIDFESDFTLADRISDTADTESPLSQDDTDTTLSTNDRATRLQRHGAARFAVQDRVASTRYADTVRYRC